jgi:hypothetical protein
MPSEKVHGECVGTDADTTAGQAVILYEHGGVKPRTLGADETLIVTQVTLFVTEVGGECFLCSNTKAAGRYVFLGVFAANGGFSRTLDEPYVCPRGTGLVLFGIATGKDHITIEGEIEGS